jgi:enoyl-CoA hydratase/carnithine racemase
MKSLLIDRMKSNFGRRFLSITADSAVTWKYSGNTALLSLDRPNILNPLTTDICRNVKSKMKKWRKTMGVSCLIVKGSGKAFCAGGDIKALWHSLESMEPSKRGMMYYSIVPKSLRKCESYRTYHHF